MNFNLAKIHGGNDNNNNDKNNENFATTLFCRLFETFSKVEPKARKGAHFHFTSHRLSLEAHEFLELECGMCTIIIFSPPFFS